MISKKPDVSRMLDEDVQRYYSEAYYQYQAAINSKNVLIVKDQQMISDFLSTLPSSTRLLDIGCGSCQWFNSMKHVDLYIGIDVNKDALQIAPDSSKLETIQLNIFEGPFVASLIEQKSLNLVFFSFFLSHFTNETIDIIFEEISGVDSIIVVDSFWGTAHQRKYVNKHLDLVERKTPQNYLSLLKRFFDYNDLQELAQKYGYKVLRYQNGIYWAVYQMKKVFVKL